MFSVRSLYAAATIMMIAGSAVFASAAAPLKVHEPISIPGGSGRFDYMTVDSGMHRLFATHKGVKQLAVLDLRTKAVMPSINVGTTQGIVVDRKAGTILLGGEEEHRIVVLNRSTLAIQKIIATPGPVDAIALDTRNGLLYADHDDDTAIFVVNTSHNRLVKSISIPSGPEYICYDSADNYIYQNIKRNNTVLKISPKSGKIVATWSSLPALSPHGMAIDSKTGMLFSAGQNGVVVEINLKTGKRISTARIAKGVDQIAFDSGLKRIYCACHGKISVVQETTHGLTALGTVNAIETAHTLAVDPSTHSVWTTGFIAGGSYFQELTP